MSVPDSESHQILEKLATYAKNQLESSSFTVFEKFLKLFFAQMPLSDSVSRPIADLYGSAYSQWLLLCERQPGQVNINVFNPDFEQNGWESTHTVVQVAMDDMPFIVDTLRMEIYRLGLTTHLTINTGGIKVVRDAQNKVIDVLSYHDSVQGDFCLEAPVQMEIDRQASAKKLADIKKNLLRVLKDVKSAVIDWKPMCQRMQECIDAMNPSINPRNADNICEAKDFLQWILTNHFTFLGYRYYELVGRGNERALRLVEDSVLGVLRDSANSKTLRHYSELPRKARELALSEQDLIIISKTNTISTVHRPAYTDYIGVKRFNAKGELVGESRFIGLYTSEAYAMNPRAIPLVRKKVDSVLKASKLPMKSHAGKDLLHIISTLPRDDLFHASVPELLEICEGILQMQERRLTKLFVRKDAYGRFVSCLLYLPRENLTTSQILEIQELLSEVFNSDDISHNTFVSESVLARVNFVIKVDPREALDYDLRKLETLVKEMTKSWEDDLHTELLDYFGEERGIKLVNKYCHAFPAGYREVFDPRIALIDIEHIENLSSDDDRLGMSIYRPLGASRHLLRFKLYRLHQTVPLSDAVPMLENMGLRVVGEQPYRLHFPNGNQVWINDFCMNYSQESNFEIDQVKEIFQEAFQRIWKGDAQNDPFNQLVLEAQMSWREVSVLRAYTKYFRQMGFVFTEQYTATTLIKYHKIAKLLMEYFKFRFDPKVSSEERDKKTGELNDLIKAALDQVATLDEDRMLRRYLVLINATLRTNYFQLADKGGHKPYLAFKLNPSLIPELPLPLPRYEIYVYSPRFEGIHLRSAKVARGGLRWSDRLEDYRTEILGLMKAQQVKNSLIVPAGAKGGFVTKCLAIGAKREEVLREGIACYQNFIRGLLDVTDDIVKTRVIHRTNTVCYDQEDPYLVVAADKGTATFSDIANTISEERGYWLGDAFASGGSTGYDHKKMGITARGAWVSAERHFQNLGINVNKQQITVVGIGDMSGDVFGNGLLMTPHLKLVAAFNHMHIFLDPKPDASVSFAERKRLFDLPRSSWEDYDNNLISQGGGVYSRASKAIPLSPQVQALLNIDVKELVPNELIKAILKAPVDLLWNGGIGTYVKACTETNMEVGDRTNDAVRINGEELNARVVCEGGNLGLTQRGRIEYALSGGYINTDFIDNSAGVDCSDHEVNIKILLNAVVTKGDMTLKQRNTLLAEMSDEVAALVLRDNYEQNRVISVSSFYSNLNIGLVLRAIQALEKSGKLNRELEFLPEDKVILERRSLGKTLTRPEIAVLLSYTKNVLKGDIVKTDLVKDAYLSQMVQQAFPTPLRARFKKAMDSHYLASEIIATQISNQMVSDMGISFVHQLQDETGVSVEAVVRAYAVAREIFKLESYNQAIRSLDYQVKADLQYEMIQEGMRLVRRAARWFLRNRREMIDIAKTVSEFRNHVESISDRLPKLMLGGNKERFDAKVAELVEQNVPQLVAVRVASSPRVYHALNVVEAALVADDDVFRVAKIYFMLVDRLDLLWFRDQINAYPVSNHWSILAKAACKADLDWVQRALTAQVLADQARSIPGKVNHWFDLHETVIGRWKSIISDLRSAEAMEFSILFVAIRELMDLVRTTTPSSED